MLVENSNVPEYANRTVVALEDLLSADLQGTNVDVVKLVSLVNRHLAEVYEERTSHEGYRPDVTFGTWDEVEYVDGHVAADEYVDSLKLGEDPKISQQVRELVRELVRDFVFHWTTVFLQIKMEREREIHYRTTDSSAGVSLVVSTHLPPQGGYTLYTSFNAGPDYGSNTMPLSPHDFEHGDPDVDQALLGIMADATIY